MATPLSSSAVLTALQAEGVHVVEVGSWRTHNRGNRGTGWGPVHGVMVHHTVSSGTDASVRLCRNGYAGLPGPLCHAVSDKEGRIHLVGHGRANHAGSGDADVLDAVRNNRPLPAPRRATVDGNARFYGVEAINLGDGKDPWPPGQLEAIARWAAALCRAHGWSERRVIGHAEWQSGKIDPRGPGANATTMMNRIRNRVAQLLAVSGSPAGEHTVKPDETLSSIGARHGVAWEELARLNRIDPPYVIFPGQRLRLSGAEVQPPPQSPPPQEEEEMPDHVLFEFRERDDSPAKTIPADQWTLVEWNLGNNGRWVERKAEPSVLTRPMKFQATAGIRLRGVKPGTEVQIRFSRWVPAAGGGWKRDHGYPIDSPAHVGGGAHFTHFGLGTLNSSQRLRLEVLHFSRDTTVTCDYARFEAFTWEP